MLEHLKELGLSEGTIKIYEALLQLGPSSLTKIQQKTGMERRNIYDILNKLIEQGLTSYTNEQKKRIYQITNPKTIQEKIQEKRNKLQALEQELPSIFSAYNDKKQPVTATIYRGIEGIKNLLEETLEHKEQHWLGGNSGVEQTQLKNWFKHWMQKRADKKIMMYDLVDKGTYLEGLEPEKTGKHKHHYYERQELPEKLKSPLVIVIYGNKIAQILWLKQPFAFVIESTEAKESFMKWFNYFWKKKK
ncbi:MAG: helix-turn-helix domain-containing protein [Nanoarchaeota archaeon]|nr:helix-turn-helix domain-containing protein [Nanoarchaeota archaeon]